MRKGVPNRPRKMASLKLRPVEGNQIHIRAEGIKKAARTKRFERQSSIGEDTGGAKQSG